MENIPTWIPVVALALQARDGRWLMQRRPPHKHHGGLWEFPGGKVEPIETPREALVREIAEEVGITIAAADLVPAAMADAPPLPGTSPLVILLYTCSAWTGEPAALEGGEIGWFSGPEVEALDKPPLDRVLARQLFAQYAG